MAKTENSSLIWYLLGLFLSFVIIVVLASLYADAYRKITLLREDVERLTSSQVLLMVPEEEAAGIADWLTKHPEQTQAIVRSASGGQAKSVLIGPNVHSPNQPISYNGNTISDPNHSSHEVIVSENAQGVKVISLPNGGIRVTTREDSSDEKQ